MASISWQFNDQEIQSIQKTVADYADTPFVQHRVKRNVDQPAPEVSRSEIWNAHLAAQLTSQQRSGPDSPVTTFLREDSTSLSLQSCQDADDVTDIVATTLEEYGGIRFYNKIGEACAENLRLLEQSEQQGWKDLEEKLLELRKYRQQEPQRENAPNEREVCRYVTEGIAGEGFSRIGPKQSRNMLQILGLTRYETPLDSRITRWMNEHLDLPYHLSAGGLSESAFYDFHMDLIQEACVRADVLPCVFDAAVFVSFDSEWSEDIVESILF